MLQILHGNFASSYQGDLKLKKYVVELEWSDLRMRRKRTTDIIT